ncbi:MAG TPA: hypothetical protein VEP48_00330 [Methylomirabilota bacterium]|nr:hypothetical protein [Methylomirabilota bacterium]
MRISRSLLRPALIVVAALVALVGLSFAARAGAPTTVAASGDLSTQRSAAERSIDRVYKFGLEQLKTTRGLKLAISDAQAAAIERSYATQLKDLRHSALQAIADAYALRADQAAAYIAHTEERLDTSPAASAPPVMLAPRLYQVVQRMADLGSQLTETGIREMTKAPTGGPSPSPSPSATTRPNPTPSPTGSR